MCLSENAPRSVAPCRDGRAAWHGPTPFCHPVHICTRTHETRDQMRPTIKNMQNVKRKWVLSRGNSKALKRRCEMISEYKKRSFIESTINPLSTHPLSYSAAKCKEGKHTARRTCVNEITLSQKNDEKQSRLTLSKIKYRPKK